MSALAMILTAAMVVPRDGPKKVSEEMVRQGLDLSGDWEGTTTYAEKARRVTLNHFCCWEYDGSRVCISRWEIKDEGQGKFRLSEYQTPYAGIYEWRGDCIALCYCQPSKGRPTSFKAGDGQCLIILRRVKSK